MKRRYRHLLWSIVSVASVNGAKATSPEQAVVLQIERDTAQAWLSSDAKFIDALETPEYVFTGTTGVVSGKAEDVRMGF